MEKRYYQEWKSPLGKIAVCCSDKGVCAVAWGAFPPRRTSGNGSERPFTERIPAEGRQERGAQLARQTVAELGEYFAGGRRRFSAPLDLRGTPFQLKVWKALTRIPSGQTRSYQQIARAVGNPRAARAVGMANHRNPVAILVPCHRVICSDGSLGGYAGGLRNKARMLRLEQACDGR